MSDIEGRVKKIVVEHLSIEEEKIYAIRTAVSLSPDSVYTKLIDIPAKLNEEEAVNYILDPYSPLQIPISIRQTDFDISKTCCKSLKNSLLEFNF